MHRRLGSATLPQLAFTGEGHPNFPFEKFHWDNTVVKSIYIYFFFFIFFFFRSYTYVLVLIFLGKATMAVAAPLLSAISVCGALMFTWVGLQERLQEQRYRVVSVFVVFQC